MNKNIPEDLLEEITDVLSTAINRLVSEYTGDSLTDIFLSVNQQAGEISVYDDEENIIISKTIKYWEDNLESLDESEIIDVLTESIQELVDNDAFELLDIYMPFSVSYVDDEMNVIQEILTVTEDSLVHLDDELLDKFDKDFDEFMKRLMEE